MKFNRILYFYFYVSDDFAKSESNNIHRYCLGKYICIFDKSLIYISVDDVSNIKLIDSFKTWISEYVDCSNVDFIVVQNDKVCREATVFKRCIVDKLHAFSDSDIVFFAHSKGFTNTAPWMSRDGIRHWIAGMYYFNLNYTNEAEDILADDHTMSYGMFRKEYWHGFNRNNWHYSGTFFWINPSKIKNYIMKFEVSLSSLRFGRYYAEAFLGNIYPSSFSASHVRLYKDSADLTNYKSDKWINILLNEYDKKNYMEFYNKMIENIK